MLLFSFSNYPKLLSFFVTNGTVDLKGGENETTLMPDCVE
jgi:hypothetical protein